MQHTVGGELLTAACQNLMSVGLMPHVPHDAVIGCVEDIMQSHRQFHYAQARSQMTRVYRQLLHDGLPELIAHLWKLLNGQFAQLVGVVYMVEYLYFLCFHD